MKEGRVRWQAVSSTWKRAHIRAQALRLERCLPSLFFFSCSADRCSISAAKSIAVLPRLWR